VRFFQYYQNNLETTAQVTTYMWALLFNFRSDITKLYMCGGHTKFGYAKSLCMIPFVPPIDHWNEWITKEGWVGL